MAHRGHHADPARRGRRAETSMLGRCAPAGEAAAADGGGGAAEADLGSPSSRQRGRHRRQGRRGVGGSGRRGPRGSAALGRFRIDRLAAQCGEHLQRGATANTRRPGGASATIAESRRRRRRGEKGEGRQMKQPVPRRQARKPLIEILWCNLVLRKEHGRSKPDGFVEIPKSGMAAGLQHRQSVLCRPVGQSQDQVGEKRNTIKEVCICPDVGQDVAADRFLIVATVTEGVLTCEQVEDGHTQLPRIDTEPLRQARGVFAAGAPSARRPKLLAAVVAALLAGHGHLTECFRWIPSAP
mmetsp:Transcript_119043/g.379674  ORF Transcript_119043/g.379674 Transcript_119043/m.379674 type:complete len:297 (+) Transcript_119043:277-1167(+)